MKSKLIIVGGFLGAGKTSLLFEAAKRLRNKTNVGLITNDQADELVDTTLLKTGGGQVKEVSGSCFCCNFNGFWAAIDTIRQQNQGGVILAEPVGSCTDLSATLCQPLKVKYPDKVELTPLSVLADPFKLQNLMEGALSSSAYIRLKQMEEADAILITKVDLLSSEERKSLREKAEQKWPSTCIFEVSSTTGEGLDEWLDWVQSGQYAGTKIAEVDYDIYAAGEAAYGWLNATYTLSSPVGMEQASGLLNGLSDRFEKVAIEVGHVKFILQTSSGLFMGNLTGSAKTQSIRFFDSKATEFFLTVNARAETSPQFLEQIIIEEVFRTFGKECCKLKKMNTLIPGRPNPTYRYNTVYNDKK